MSISELYLEARQHCDSCKCDGRPLEDVSACVDALKILEIIVTM